MNLPSQWVPLPRKPGLHVHWKPPSTLVHVALILQSPVPLAHSSVSTIQIYNEILELCDIISRYLTIFHGNRDFPQFLLLSLFFLTSSNFLKICIIYFCNNFSILTKKLKVFPYVLWIPTCFRFLFCKSIPATKVQQIFFNSSKYVGIHEIYGNTFILFC